MSVEDQGPGIAAEHLPHVFDRFYKAEVGIVHQSDGARRMHPARHANGSGLGLSIVKAIVERHGGRISVESRPGRTVFRVHNQELGHQFLILKLLPAATSVRFLRLTPPR